MKDLRFRIKDRRGFTLIEAVVATAVFAFIVSSIIGVYISTLELNRKSRAEQATIENGNFIMQFLGKEVRDGSVYYPDYPSGTVPSNPTLYIENQANQIEQVSLSGQNMVLTKSGNSSNLNSGDVKITNLKFLISPATDPYLPAKTTNIQPHVTVLLELTSNYGNTPADISKLDLQATFSSRNYPSR